MNPQEIFDTVAAHLIKQGRRAMSTSSSTCAYKNSDGLQCAVGVLLPEDTPAEILSSRHTISALLGTYPGVLPVWMKEQEDLLMSLQKVHDNENNWSRRGFRGFKTLDAVAERYGLVGVF
jgi:hypothetical protein